MATQTTVDGDADGGDVPRDPAAWRPTNHFAERFADRYDEHRRHLDGEVVRRCITAGDVVRQDRSTVRFEADIAGVTFVLVANPVQRTIVSGFPDALDWDRALDSGRWSRRQLEDVDAFLRAK